MSDDMFESDEPAASDFRRANGSPLVRSLDGKKWERYSRPSSWGKDLDALEALNIWKLDRAIEGVAVTPSLAARIAANLGRKEGRKELREQAIQIGRGEEAADLGTALHAMAHRLETDPSFKCAEPFASDLAAYLSAIDRAGLETTHSECHLCADIWRAAGTADRIYRCRRELRLPDGSVAAAGTSFIGDLKTGRKLDYALPGYAIQEAIYCDSMFYDVETDERSPLPDRLHTGWGLLVHLPAGQASATLLWCDLQIGRDGARIVQQVREWRRREDFSYPFTFPESDEVAVLSSGRYDLEHPQISAQAVYDVEHPTAPAWKIRAHMGAAELSQSDEPDEGDEDESEEPVDDVKWLMGPSFSESIGLTGPVGEVEAAVEEHWAKVDAADAQVADEFEGEWLKLMVPWTQARIRRIGTIPDARALLINRWPQGVKPLPEAMPTCMHLAEVLDLVDAIESAFSLPFLEGDPRVSWNMGKRRGDPSILRGNQPSQTS